MRKIQKIVYFLVMLSVSLFCIIPHLGVSNCKGDLSVLYSVEEKFRIGITYFFLIWFLIQIVSILKAKRTS